ANLARTQCSNSPAREKILAHKRLPHAARALHASNSRQQTMSRIRRSHSARPLLAVQSERIGRQVLAPEGLLKALPQRLCLCLQFLGPLYFSQSARGTRGFQLGRVDIALHFAKRNRPVS